jgi:integrase
LYRKQQLPEHLQSTLRHYLFMCTTGMRFSDVVNAAKFENKLGNKLIYIPHKTSRFKRETICLPLTSLASQLISDEGANTGAFFTLKAEQVMNRQLKQIATMAGIKKNITTHTGRHTFASLFLSKTKNIVVLQKLLGHSRITETMVYVHLSEGETEREMEVFETNFN